MYIHIVIQFDIKPVYIKLNRCTFVINMTDIDLTIQIQHNTVENVILNIHPKWESTVLSVMLQL
jgi:hypothetical protein